MINTITIIRKIDWNNKLNANPLANQKKILMIDDIKIIAQTSIEKDPNDFYLRISCNCEIYPKTGPTAFTIH